MALPGLSALSVADSSLVHIDGQTEDMQPTVADVNARL